MGQYIIQLVSFIDLVNRDYSMKKITITGWFQLRHQYLLAENMRQEHS